MSLVDYFSSLKEFASLDTNQHIPKVNVYKHMCVIVEADLKKVLVVLYEFKFCLHMNACTSILNGG
jgi:hypothetical protein